MLQQIACPRCQSPISADIHQVVDAQRTPELKYALLNGQLNVFSCPNCGLSGQLASPLLYHDAEHELFAVYVPMELNLPHVEQERLIGRLVKDVMDSMPPEQRRGYMLQPETIINYQTFIEKVLETEGITPEMIARQRKQAELVGILAKADDEVFEILIEERGDELDETFFALVQNALQGAEQSQDNATLLEMTNLQAKLYTETEVGRRVEKRQAAVRSFEQDVRREENLTPQILLKHILANQDEEEIVQSLAMAGQSALDYTFFVMLTEEIERVARQKDKVRVRTLTGIRQMLLEFQKSLDEANKQVVARANETLKVLLTAEDRRAAIREHQSELDEPFMYLLSARIEHAEQNGNEAEAMRMRMVYDMIMEEAESQVPPEVRLVNSLLRAESDAAQRELLDENPQLVTPQLAQMLTAVSGELGDDSPAELREQLKQVQAMVEMRLA